MIIKSCLATLVASVFALPLCGASTTTAIRLLLPQDGATTRTNAPVLAWSPATEVAEIWIDGIRMAEVKGERTTYVPFPLSFGEHRWKVVSIQGGKRNESPEASFKVDDVPLARLPEGAVLLRHNWDVQSSETAGSDGAVLSSAGVSASGWARTSVPSTVLTALVRNGVYPNPYVALNNTFIPDAHVGFSVDNDLIKYSHIPGKNPWVKPYWFRTAFKVPAGYAGKRVWLTFNEINYRAEVWLNGTRLADPQEMVGMDRAFRLDVTNAINRGGDNFLAVAIHPLDHPGRPEPVPVTPLADPGRNMGADMDISLNYSKWDTVGWDWQPEIRDRDIGITEDVFLSATDEVELGDLYVASDLNLSDTSRASLLLSCKIVNSSSTTQKGVLRAVVSDDRGVAVKVEQAVEIEAGKTQSIEWTPATRPDFVVKRPRLWWPTGLGEPHLYSVAVEFKTSSGIAVKESTTLGIRKLETLLSPLTQSRIFKVNGRDVYGQGGNWVIDMMLNSTASRYEQEIATARQANLNFLRIWGPTGAPPECFYDAADRQGMLLQQDFLHDHWGTERNTPGFAPPEDIFEKATVAIIKRYRNHPSLFLWCGGNEGPNPREELITKKLLPALDPWGTRYYLSASLADGLQGGGPYHNLPPRDYFDNRKIADFNSEIGPSGVPVWESLREFLSLEPTTWAPNRYPIDGEWAYHDATDRLGENENRKYSHLDDLVRNRYGALASNDTAAARDYVEKAQLLNYETYRASMEALNQHLWKKSTGFAMWKYNSSWPSVLWQLTDWYQQLHAGSYSFRRALEPVHVQLNLKDQSISVVNRTHEKKPGLVVKAELFDLSMKSVWSKTAKVNVADAEAVTTDLIVPTVEGVTFLKLRLKDGSSTVSDNFYWLDSKDQFSDLSKLAPAEVSMTLKAPSKGKPAKVTLKNRGKTPALMVRVRLIDKASGVEALPVYWSDNYVNLLPGEKVELTVSPEKDGFPGNPAIEVSGFNVPKAIDTF